MCHVNRYVFKVSTRFQVVRAYPIDEIDDRWESMAFDDNRCQLID